jgi:hypothetical protein
MTCLHGADAEKALQAERIDLLDYGPTIRSAMQTRSDYRC